MSKLGNKRRVFSDPVLKKRKVLSDPDLKQSQNEAEHMVLFSIGWVNTYCMYYEFMIPKAEFEQFDNELSIQKYGLSKRTNGHSYNEGLDFTLGLEKGETKEKELYEKIEKLLTKESSLPLSYEIIPKLGFFAL